MFCYSFSSAIHLEQFCKYLDERETAQREEKQKELEEVYATLKQQVHQPKNNAIDKGEPLDLENCGPSSIQRFQGEDADYDSRKMMQQQQVCSVLLFPSLSRRDTIIN